MATSLAVVLENDYGANSYDLYPRTTLANGTQRQIVDPLDLGEVAVTRFLQPVPFGPGQIELGFVYDKPRRVAFEIHSRCATEDKAFKEFKALTYAFNPSGNADGPATPLWLRVDWTDTDGAVSRYLEVRPVRMPGFGWGVGGRASFKGLYSAGVLRYPVELEALYPFWRDHTPTTHSSMSSFHSTPQVVNIAGSGNVAVGVRVEILAITGSCTALSVVNSATGNDGEGGGALNWSKAGGFTAGDYIDYRYTDPSVVTVSAGVLSATDYLRLFHLATNDLTCTKVTGSPSNLKLSFTYRWAWF